MNLMNAVTAIIALLAVSACPPAEAVQLRDFAPRGSTIKSMTGFEEHTLQHMWDKYNAYAGSPPGTFGGQLPPIVRGGLQRRAYHFLCVFLYIHQLPQNNWDGVFKLCNGKKIFRMTATHWQPMHDVADALASIITEIVYDDRLDLFNHVGGPFSYFYTGIVDVFPVFVPAPHSFSMRRQLFQPKYDACVYKIQIAVTFMGNIILWTGPHLGCESDKKIWDDTWDVHPFYWWEWWLADLGYVGALGLIYKFKVVASAAMLYFNNVHEWFRNRVENVIGRVKAHRLFKRGCYRGSYAHLAPLITIVGHVTAFELRARQRFETIGPWRHKY